VQRRNSDRVSLSRIPPVPAVISLHRSLGAVPFLAGWSAAVGSADWVVFLSRSPVTSTRENMQWKLCSRWDYGNIQTTRLLPPLLVSAGHWNSSHCNSFFCKGKGHSLCFVVTLYIAKGQRDDGSRSSSPCNSFFFAAFAGSLKLNFRSLPVSAGQRNLCCPYILRWPFFTRLVLPSTCKCS